MLAEIIYTVRSIARHHRLEAEPFFIVAIIAAIRRILVITAESSRNVNLDDPHFQAALVELGLLALIVLALAGAMRLIPAHAAEDGSRMGGNVLGLLELLLVFGVVVGFGVWQLVSLRRATRTRRA